jgi:predicted N-acyltransferase
MLVVSTKHTSAPLQGEHKLQRGLLPNFTYSAHHIADPTMRSAVGKFLANENSQVRDLSGFQGTAPC